MRTLADAHRLRASAIAAPGSRPVVVGGGLIGVEVASALAALGLRPVLIEQADSLWAGALGERVAAWGLDRLEEAGVEVRLSSRVTEVGPGFAALGEERLDAAFAVIGVGVRPRIDLARDTGIAVDDGIVTDAEHRSSHPAVWAAGDVAKVDGLRFEHWHAAREGGERAARSMLGLSPEPARAPWLFTEVAGATLDVFGKGADVDEERSLGDAVVARSAGGRLVQLAAIGTAIDPEIARGLVEAGAPASEVAQAIVAG
jgi:NADPH-dependent 2,4-dienoyl-CoA reductase/sulfur reductase-like enzyme